MYHKYSFFDWAYSLIIDFDLILIVPPFLFQILLVLGHNQHELQLYGGAAEGAKSAVIVNMGSWRPTIMLSQHRVKL